MLKRSIIILVILFSFQSAFAQSIELPQTALSGISFSVEAHNIPDSIKTIELNLLGANTSYLYKLEVTDGEVNKESKIENSGKYEIRNSIEPHKT